MMGYDSMMPYYTPFPNSAQTYYPTLQHYLTDGQVDPLRWDLSSLKYRNIYRSFYDFYNRNINAKLNHYKDDDDQIGDLNDLKT